MCPSDTYKVYKRGCNVRIDTTLLGFEQSTWQRGNRSYIFKGQRDAAVMVEIDHDTRQVYVEQQSILASHGVSEVGGGCGVGLRATEEVVAARLTTPIVSTFIDTDKISFERNRSGIWGWRNDKTEVVNGYDCKVYNACNVELVTKTRMEHLTDADKSKTKQTKSSFESFLGIAETEEAANGASAAVNGDLGVALSLSNPCNLTVEEYLDESVDLLGKDIGRPKEITNKIQKFKANLWLCDDFPLSLQEQVLPIVDLMAISNSHFAKLKDFITLQLPSGFPIKIEIPLFHILNARVTFGNIFATDTSVLGVSTLRESNGQLSCVLCDSVFEPPSDYLRLGVDSRRQFSMEDDDELMQCAIQQNLMDEGAEREKVTIWEALRNQPSPHYPISSNFLCSDEEEQIQRAIHDSLMSYQNEGEFDVCLRREEVGVGGLVVDGSVVGGGGGRRIGNDEDVYLEEQLRLAIELSEKEKLEEEKRRQAEDEMFEKILQLSLTET
ncbi:hypothetical protein CHUAL_005999 [Chamberlinius hualienensis]